MFAEVNNRLDEYGFDVELNSFTRFEFVLVSCAAYLGSVLVLSPTKENEGDESPSFVKTGLIFAHNFALCVFSVVCFASTAPIFYTLATEGWVDMICKEKFAGIEEWWYWTHLFYLSKYYEFLDTYILIWKGKKPSFLQKFHHVGAVLGMWIITTSRSHTTYIFMIPNSFIHSLMYLYYALSVLKIRVPFKSLLTIMQMTQFCLCLCFGVTEIYHWNCQKLPDRVSIIWNSAYVPVLLLLFTLFYRKRYKAKKP